jgi:glutathionyl-hydroquinone reductase
VPALWDRQTRRLVSNNFPDITIDLGTQFGAWSDAPFDLYPPAKRADIDALNERVYETVNNEPTGSPGPRPRRSTPSSGTA